MSVVTYEGIVENGQIHLKADVHLPDKTKVYVVVPETDRAPSARIISPRLANPQKQADFVMEIAAEPVDARL